MDRSTSIHLLPREHHADLIFHSVQYSIYSAIKNEDELIIEAEQVSDGNRWAGFFSKKYIEEMTANTGNFKKFSVFVNMLWSAFQGCTESVYVDLLTSSDLDNLRNRTSHIKSEPGSSSKPNSRSSNKRYLILTYTVEFDRVHYPLLLKHVDIPETTALQRTIQRLRSEIQSLRQAPQQPNREQIEVIRSLQEENRNLLSRVNDDKQNHEAELLALQQSNVDIREQLSRERLKVQSLTSQLEKLKLQCLQYERERTLRMDSSSSVKTRNESPSTANISSRNGHRRPSRSRSSIVHSPGPGRLRRHPLIGRESPSPVRRKGRSRSPRIPRFDPTAYVQQKRDQLKNRSPSPWGKPPPLKPLRSSSTGRRSTTATIVSTPTKKLGKENRNARFTRSSSRDAIKNSVARDDSQPTAPRRPPSKTRSPSVSSSSSSDCSSYRRSISPQRQNPFHRIFPPGQIRAVDERLSELHTFLKVAKTANRRKLTGK